MKIKLMKPSLRNLGPLSLELSGEGEEEGCKNRVL